MATKRYLTSVFWFLSSVLVGRGGFEPPTSRLSSARSNQLSYQPVQMTDDRRPVSGAWLLTPETGVFPSRKGCVDGGDQRPFVLGRSL